MAILPRLSDGRSVAILMTPRLTLVTALFDLARREAPTTRVTVSEYFRRGEFVLGLDCDVVFYVDPELADEVRARREDNGLAAKTLVVEAPLETLTAHGLLPAVRSARERHPLVNGDPAKDTP